MSLRVRLAVSLSVVMVLPLLTGLAVVLAGGSLIDRLHWMADRPWLAGALVIAALAAVVRFAVLLSRSVPTVAEPDAVTDLTERLQLTETELTERERLLTDTFAQFGHALASTHDLDGLMRVVIEAARRGSGATVGTVLLGEGDRLTERVSAVPDGADGLWVGDVLERLNALARAAISRGQVCTAEFEPIAGGAIAAPIRRGRAVVGALAVAGTAGSGALDRVAIAAVRDLAAQAGVAVANVEEHLNAQRLSITDALTGAGNVRHLTATLNREVERAHRFRRTLSVLMLDLDHFKLVNDQAGHDFGDAVLREFANRLHGCLREVDLVARRGGEEFAVVLPETGPAGAEAVARRILDRVRSAPFSAGGIERVVTVSIGVASYPDHADSAAAVMRAADVALYAAKRAGRDRWVMAPSTASPLGALPMVLPRGSSFGA